MTAETLQDFVARFSRPYWLDEPLLTAGVVLPQVTGSDLDHTIEQLSDAISRRRVGRAMNWTLLGLRLDERGFLARARRTGTFRCSKYGYDGSAISHVAENVQRHQEQFGFSEDTARYFRSVENLATLSTDVRGLVRSVENFIAAHRMTALKTLLAGIDMRFWQQVFPDRAAPTDLLKAYSCEDLAEAFSFVVHTYARKYGLPASAFDLFDERLALSPESASVLINACKLRKFQEWEVCMDVLDYELLRDASSGAHTMRAPEPAMEKAIHFGYVQTDIQRMLFADRTRVPEAGGIAAAGRLFFEKFGERLVEYVPEPVARYRFHIPQIPELLELFRDRAFFGEELQALKQVARDTMATVDEVLAVELRPGLDMWDVVRVQRFLAFMSYFTGAHLEPLLQNRPGLVGQSLVPRFTRNALVEMLTAILDDAAKAEAAIEFLSWTPESSTMLDLQYQPFLLTEDIVTVPLNVVGMSNVVRNALWLSRSRVHGENTGDVLTEEVADAFRAINWPVASNRKYRFRDASGDLDVVTLSESTLFLMECKAPLHPCSVHELRTSFDHIRKASEQLSRVRTLWPDDDFRQYLSRLLGWDLSGVTKLVTCIVAGNRMFSGYRHDGHAVRSVYELVTFVRSGQISFGDSVVRLWRGETISPGDLEAYVEEDLFHKHPFNVMNAVTREYAIGSARVAEDLFFLDPVALAASFGVEVSESLEEQAPRE